MLTPRDPFTFFDPNCNPSRHFLLALICGLTLFGCGVSPGVETSRRFQRAEQLFSEAASPDDFAHAAAAYQEIVDSGFASGNVYYNLGNAWLQADETGRAIAAYRQALRIMPRDPYLSANLKLALRQSGRETNADASVWDYVFFWQDSLSISEKAMVLTGILAALLGLAIAAQLRWRRQLMKRLAVAVSLLLVVASTSLARDWIGHQPQRNGVVVEDVTGRKGNAESYEPAFNNALQNGTEFVVKGRQGDWLQIDITGAGEAWIPQRAAVTY